MDKTTYDSIIAHCGSKKGFISDFEKSHIIRNFLEDFYKSVEDHKKKNNGENPTKEEELTIQGILLNSMDNYIIAANNSHKEFESTVEKRTKRVLSKSELTSVLISLGINLLASLIFWIFITLMTINITNKIENQITDLINDKLIESSVETPEE